MLLNSTITCFTNESFTYSEPIATEHARIICNCYSGWSSVSILRDFIVSFFLFEFLCFLVDSQRDDMAIILFIIGELSGSNWGSSIRECSCGNSFAGH